VRVRQQRTISQTRQGTEVARGADIYDATRLKVPRFFTVIVLGFVACARAGDLDVIGITLLRQFDPTLMGNGVPVAHVEVPA
jgi:hypothetical protein